MEVVESAKFGPKRNAAQRLADKLFIEELLLKKKTHAFIASELAKVRDYTLSKAMIGKIWRELQAEWMARSSMLLDQVKAQELAALDLKYKETFEQWDRSKLDSVTTTTESITIKQGDGENKVTIPAERTVTKREGQCGDPALMARLLEIHDRRAKILGLCAPAKTELSGAVKVEKEFDLSSLTETQKEALDVLYGIGPATGSQGVSQAPG